MKKINKKEGEKKLAIKRRKEANHIIERMDNTR